MNSKLLTKIIQDYPLTIPHVNLRVKLMPVKN